MVSHNVQMINLLEIDIFLVNEDIVFDKSSAKKCISTTAARFLFLISML